MLLRLPRKPCPPELAWVSTFPSRSLMQISVLLKVALICAIPCRTVRRSFFFAFLAVFFPPFAMLLSYLRRLRIPVFFGPLRVRALV